MASADLEKLGNPQITLYNSTNLSAVTSATNGSAEDVGLMRDKSVFINVSVNSGAVTVNIEASHDGTTWFNLNSTTYTATTAKDIRSYTSFFKFMRTTTTTHSSATVTTNITGRS